MKVETYRRTQWGPALGVNALNANGQQVYPVQAAARPYL